MSSTRPQLVSASPKLPISHSARARAARMSSKPGYRLSSDLWWCPRPVNAPFSATQALRMAVAYTGAAAETAAFTCSRLQQMQYSRL